MKRNPTIGVNVHARDAEFSVDTIRSTAAADFKVVRIGECSILCDVPDLIRLRDVIDAHLSQNAQQEAA